MREFLAVILASYMITSSIFFPGLAGGMLLGERDCRLESGERCVWQVVPVSQADQEYNK